MVDFSVLKAYGSDNASWREFFVRRCDGAAEGETEDQRELRELHGRRRSELVDMLTDRASAGAIQSLSTSHVIQACDLAYRGNMLNGAIVPLLMYAQGRIGNEECVKSLLSTGCDQFVITDQDDKTGNGSKVVNSSKFTELSIGLVRSVVNRRRDAQANLFRSLRPLFRYQPRGGAESDALIADLLTQRVESMSDQFGFRAQHDDWALDLALYPYSLVVPACSWQRDVQLMATTRRGVKGEVRREGAEVIGITENVEKSGVPLMSFHPSRVFWDQTYPLKTINTDTGVEFFGGWDVIPRRSVEGPDFFDYANGTSGGVETRPAWMGRIEAYGSYFNSYYPSVGTNSSTKPLPGEVDAPIATAMLDEPTWVTHMYCKLKPCDWGVGEYPHKVWVHFILADESRVIFAEVMPTCPGAVMAHNSSQHHSIWLSMANELMSFEDQLSKLVSTMLSLVAQDAENIIAINTDLFQDPESKECLNKFISALRTNNFAYATNILKYSGTALKSLFGQGGDPRGILTRISASTADAIAKNLQAQAAVIANAERTIGMSSLEVGQPISKTASASESNAVFMASGVTSDHMSDDLDDFREAVKRILRSHIVCYDDPSFVLPVAGKYDDSTYASLGLSVEKGPDGRVTNVTGYKWLFESGVQFTSQDGADRPPSQAEYAALTQLLSVAANPQVAQMIGRDGVITLINRIFRAAGPNMSLVARDAPQAAPPIDQAQTSQF